MSMGGDTTATFAPAMKNNYGGSQTINNVKKKRSSKSQNNQGMAGAPQGTDPSNRITKLQPWL